MHETPTLSAEDLVARLFYAAGQMRDMPGIFQKIR